ncbi:MAG TPA: sortase [Propionibacteriaceae bacterium]|jgi:sortase A|nr:sortase [Propionibacteriaceae bacterium]
MRAGRCGPFAAATLVVLLLAGCSTPTAADGRSPASEHTVSVSARPSSAGPSATAPASATVTPTPTAAPTRTEPPVLASDGRPREARLSIPALGLERLRVRPYRGTPDDARGTRIQDGGIAASPYGAGGTVGVGGIGNYLITGHRTSSTRPFARLPGLKKGAKVHLVAGGKRYTYEITATRITSFRSKRSLARQSAAVPGRIGVEPTQAMITLSTCRTPEDHAEGNFWSDRFDNPEHRIDKIGVLVRIDAV